MSYFCPITASVPYSCQLLGLGLHLMAKMSANALSTSVESIYGGSSLQVSGFCTLAGNNYMQSNGKMV
jgi:hypothetical protein